MSRQLNQVALEEVHRCHDTLEKLALEELGVRIILQSMYLIQNESSPVPDVTLF